MLLSILLPTYNRVEDITRNLLLLINYIEKLHIKDSVEIIISDNFSPDNTVEKLNAIIEENNFNIVIYKQSENIGLEKNALFVLEKAVGKYVMYIGDDDFIDMNYLKDVVSEIQLENAPTVILNSILGVTKENEIVGSRGIGEKRQRFKLGYAMASLKMYLGNQLSGMTFLRENTFESYKTNTVNNIYLFVYFIGFNMLRGDFLYITEYPVKVTEGAKKDWGYHYDGLLNDLFRNYAVLFKGKPLLRAVAEIQTLINQPFRFGQYLNRGIKVILLHLKSILISKNISVITKILYIPIILIKIFPIVLRKTISRKIIK